MKVRRFLIESATLIVAAIVLGLVANAIAGSERKISLAAPETPARQSTPAAAVPTAEQPSITEDPAVPGTITDIAAVPATETATTPGVVPAGSPPAPNTGKATRAQILERFPPNPDVPSEDITTADAKWLWDQGVIFLDARRTSVYNEGHIPRARSVAVWEADVDEKVKQLAGEGLDPDTPIVIYCSGGECQDSHMLAQKLWGMFFNNLRIYSDGFPAWQQSGYPVNRGTGS